MQNAFRALKVEAARAGLPAAGLHTRALGSKRAAHQRRASLNVVVCEVPGHSSIAITGDVYGHVAPNVSRRAVDILGRCGRNGGQPVPVSAQGPVGIFPDTAPELHSRTVGLTGFEPATS